MTYWSVQVTDGGSPKRLLVKGRSAEEARAAAGRKLAETDIEDH